MIVLILMETTDVIHYWNVRILEYDMKQKDEANWGCLGIRIQINNKAELKYTTKFMIPDSNHPKNNDICSMAESQTIKN